MTNKDEAIHKALKVLNCLNNDRVYETAWVKGAIQACKEALEQPRNFCERCGKRASKDPYHIHTCTPPQALEQPTMTYEQGFDHGYEAHRVEQELEQPAQDPVACMFVSKEGGCEEIGHLEHHYDGEFPDDFTPLYTHPAPTWQGLSDDEINQTCLDLFDTPAMQGDLNFAYSIEARLKENNMYTIMNKTT